MAVLPSTATRSLFAPECLDRPGAPTNPAVFLHQGGYTQPIRIGLRLRGRGMWPIFAGTYTTGLDGSSGEAGYGSTALVDPPGEATPPYDYPVIP